jgi:hypothetical protein
MVSWKKQQNGKMAINISSRVHQFTNSPVIKLLLLFIFLASLIEVKQQGELHGILKRIIALNRYQVGKVQAEDIISQPRTKGKELPVSLVF